MRRGRPPNTPEQAEAARLRVNAANARKYRARVGPPKRVTEFLPVTRRWLTQDEWTGGSDAA
jgi:hypothetical protein